MDRVRVRVGETVFQTTKSTLSESELFSSLFALSPPPNGEYFVDNDLELFTHILRYLRTKLYPVFFTRASGHDKCMYSALIHQAEFYQIASLLSWLRNRKWQQAVRQATRHYMHTFVGEKQIANMDTYWEGDEELTVTRTMMSSARKHKCPAGIWQHDGRSRSHCTLNGCHVGKAVEPVVMPCLDVEGFLTKVTVQHDMLRREPADSSEVLLAAMQNPPPYQAEDDGSSLASRSLAPSILIEDEGSINGAGNGGSSRLSINGSIGESSIGGVA